MPSILQTFGKRLRLIRKRNGISQEALADLAEFDRTYISMLERGKRNPSLTCIATISRALNISPKELMPDTLTDDD